MKNKKVSCTTKGHDFMVGVLKWDMRFNILTGLAAAQYNLGRYEEAAISFARCIAYEMPPCELKTIYEHMARCFCEAGVSNAGKKFAVAANKIKITKN